MKLDDLRTPGERTTAHSYLSRHYRKLIKGRIYLNPDGVTRMIREAPTVERARELVALAERQMEGASSGTKRMWQRALAAKEKA